MIEYNPKSWLSLVFNTYSRYVMRTMYSLLLFIVAYTSGMTYLFGRYPELAELFEGTQLFLSVLGLILGLFLVFRTNSAYDKWWEGRKIWGQLLNDARGLASKLNAYLPTFAVSERRFFALMIPNFAFALKEHLRKGTKMEELRFADELDHQRVSQSLHKPHTLCTMMYEKLNELNQKNELLPEHLIVLDTEIKGFIDRLGACERIKKTPIPYSYSMYIKKFIFIYSMLLPLAFLNHFGLWSIFVSTLAFYFLASVELIAEEIEDPFGLDPNDLPLEGISISVRNGVKEAFSVKD